MRSLFVLYLLTSYTMAGEPAESGIFFRETSGENGHTPIPVTNHAGTKEDPWIAYNSPTLKLAFDNNYVGTQIVRLDIIIYGEDGAEVRPQFSFSGEELFPADKTRWAFLLYDTIKDLNNGLYFFRIRVADAYRNTSHWSIDSWIKKEWEDLPPPQIPTGTKEDPWIAYNAPTLNVTFDNTYQGKQIVRADVRFFKSDGTTARPDLPFAGSGLFPADKPQWSFLIYDVVKELDNGLYFIRVRVWDESGNMSVWSSDGWFVKQWKELDAPTGLLIDR